MVETGTAWISYTPATPESQLDFYTTWELAHGRYTIEFEIIQIIT